MILMECLKRPIISPFSLSKQRDLSKNHFGRKFPANFISDTGALHGNKSKTQLEIYKTAHSQWVTKLSFHRAFLHFYKLAYIVKHTLKLDTFPLKK